MDALTLRISAAESDVAALKSQLASAEAHLSALRLADELRPAIAAHYQAPAKQSRGGKPKGAISGDWRRTLADLYRDRGCRDTYATLQTRYELVNSKEISIASVRERVRSFTANGLLEGAPIAGFFVTDTAARRFGFDTENGEATAKPDARDEGAATPSHPPLNP